MRILIGNRLQKTSTNNQKIYFKSIAGFTIVELLVVIVVIGILASITMVSYSGISTKANIAALQSDLANSSNILKMYNANYGSYPTALNSSTKCPTAPTADGSLCLKISGGSTFTYTSNGTTFGLTETNTSGIVYNITDNTSAAAGALPVTLAISAGSNGTVNIVANQSYSPGSTPTITATPNYGYTFDSWTGNTGCSGVASHAITMDTDKSCVANFKSDPNWIAGIAATALAGKFVRSTNLGSIIQFKTDNSAIESPQGATNLDPNYLSNMTLVSPQTNPGVDFSVYPAQNACKAIGGRLPNVQELVAIYTDRTSYGNNFPTDYRYWSATEWLSNLARVVLLGSGGVDYASKAESNYARCVLG